MSVHVDERGAVVVNHAGEVLGSRYESAVIDREVALGLSPVLVDQEHPFDCLTSLCHNIGR